MKTQKDMEFTGKPVTSRYAGKSSKKSTVYKPRTKKQKAAYKVKSRSYA
tara:strand:+ start:658 stop:804 length:147 start_codon:yes stop_codon:yes gene_type:complete